MSTHRCECIDIIVEALEAAGRRVSEVRQVISPHLTRRFKVAKATLSGAKTHRMYHGTVPTAAESIAADGFRIDHSHVGAFGAGVNLTPDVKHTLLYAPSGKKAACLVVCDVAISRMHANVSRPSNDPSATSSIPDHVRPMRGYDAMYGAGGEIVVVPCCARVLPRWIVWHQKRETSHP